MNVTWPVGAGVLPRVADTVAFRVTVDPTKTGPGVGLTANEVVVGLTGGGGSGMAPVRERDITFVVPE
jgi:hypothetical protein